MILACIYLAIGLIIAWGLKGEHEEPILISDPGLAFVTLLLWPFILILLVPRMGSITFRGKTIWKKKD